MREKLELIPFLKIFITIFIGAVISMIVPISVSFAALLAIPFTFLFIRKFRSITSFALLFLLGLSLPYLQGSDETIPLNKNCEVTMLITDSTSKKDIYLCRIANSDEPILAIFKDKKQLIKGDSLRAIILPEDLRFAHYTIKKLAHGKDINLCAKVIVYEFIANSNLKQNISLSRRINNWCVKRIERLNISSSDIGIINGMLLGNREQVDKERQEQYNNTGITHMLSISGMHISIIFMILNFLFIFRNNYYVGRIIGSVIIIVVIWAYTIIVGSPISALRATIMFTLLQVSIIRILSPMQIFNTLFATATLFLLIDYKVILDIGFQLSFLSLLSILLFLPLFKGRNRLTDIIYVTISAQILTTPLVLHYFGYFSVVSIAANLLGSVAITLIMFFSIGYIIFPNIAFEFVIKYVFEGFNYFLRILSDIPYSHIDNISFSVTDIIIYYLIVILAISSIKKRV